LTAPTLNKPNKLFDRIKRDLNDLKTKFHDKLDADDAVSNSGFTIIKNDVTKISLEVAIQKGVASPDQLAQIARAREYATQLGYELRIVEIP